MTPRPPMAWPMRRLGDLAEFRNGVNYNNSSFGEGVKVVGVSDFQDFAKPKYADLAQINPAGIVTDRNMLRDGDIVFVRSNGNRELIGRSLFIDNPPEEITHSAFTIRLRFTSPEVEPQFYAYCFRTPLIRGGLTASSGGTNISNLNQDILGRLEVPLPVVTVQRRIAGILSAYDDLIENCERRIRVLDEMARALYHEWFVRFRYPGHEKTTLVDSALGRIPKGWKRGPIEEMYTGLFDGPHATPAPANEGPIFLGIGNMTEGGRLDLSSVRHIAEADFERWTKRVTPQAGDIVFTYEATLHRYALIPDDFRGCLGRRLALIRVDPAKKCGRFLFLTLLSDAWHEVVSRNTLSGATVDRVPLSKLPGFPIILPPMPLVAQFDDAVQPIVDDQTRLSKLIVNLRRTRDLLLPRLLSGQLSVEDAA